MKIIIKRSFERTRQIADFIPVKVACEASIETEQGGGVESIIVDYSRLLDAIVQQEVEKTLMGYTPACIVCGGKVIFPKKVLNKEGICAQCVSDSEMKLRELKKESGGPKSKVGEKQYD
jgi:hypothetical protein